MPSRRKKIDVNKKVKIKREFFKYSEEDLKKAISMIKSGQAVSTVSKLCKVPRTTLRNKICGNAPETTGRVGPESILGSHIENRLAEWLLTSSRMGFPINKDSLINSVKQLVVEEKFLNPFKNNIPGRKWFEGFLRRHPQIGEKKAELRRISRVDVTENIRSWFSHIESELNENREVLKDPQRVFNMDETVIHLLPKGEVVLEGGKFITDCAGDDKEKVTILLTVNANGDFAPPLTLLKNERLPKNCVASAPKNWRLRKSENGLMTCDIFYEYFTNIFHPYLVERGVQFPIIVFLDSHTSHMSIHLSKFCKTKRIILVCISSHVSHILQPLEVSFLFPLKRNWKKHLRNWEMENNGQKVQKHLVPSFMSTIISQKDFNDSIKDGFKSCGLFPFNVDAVIYSKCVQVDEDENDVNASNDMEKNDRELTHLEYLEKKIDPDLLRSFKCAKAAGICWQTDDKHESLYNIWIEYLKEDMNSINKLKSSDSFPALVEDPNLQPSENHNADDFFPEFLLAQDKNHQYFQT